MKYIITRQKFEVIDGVHHLVACEYAVGGTVAAPVWSKEGPGVGFRRINRAHAVIAKMPTYEGWTIGVGGGPLPF